MVIEVLEEVAMWGAIVGGFVGGLVGGPLGAAAGAALGAGMTADGDPDLAGEVRYEEDRDGMMLVLLPAGVPEGAIVVMRATDSDGEFLQDESALLTDDDGYFFAVSEVEDGSARFYIPFGAVKPVERQLNLAFFVMMPAADDQLVELGDLYFHVPWKRSPCRVSHFWRPLIGLCMTVARADGVLDRAEVAKVREILSEGLGIPASEKKEVVAILKEEPSADVETLVHTLATRAPWIGPADVLAALVDVAQADGRVDRSEVEVIRAVFDLWGGAAHEWGGFAEATGLDTTDRLVEYRALLEVSATATAIEIKQAYKKKVREYHPDKYQNLPPEFQHVAREMTVKLNDARDQLLRQLG